MSISWNDLIDFWAHEKILRFNYETTSHTYELYFRKKTGEVNNYNYNLNLILKFTVRECVPYVVWVFYPSDSEFLILK
jgi:hypothetical protein